MKNSGRKGKHNTSNVKQHTLPLLKEKKLDPGKSNVSTATNPWGAIYKLAAG